MFVHRTRAFSIQYLPIGCAPSTRSFVLPRKHSIRATSWYHLLHAIYGATCCWTQRFPSSGRLCGSGTTGPNSAEHSSEQSVLKLDLFVSVHICAYAPGLAFAGAHHISSQKRTSVISAYARAKRLRHACSIAQRNAPDLQLRKLIPQRDGGTGTNLGIAIDPSASCPSL